MMAQTIDGKKLKKKEISKVNYQKQIIKIDDNFVVSNDGPKADIPKCSIAEIIVEKMTNWSDDILGLVDPESDTKITYREWLDESKRFAYGLNHQLIDNSIEKSAVAMFFGDNSIEYAISAVGVVFIGLTYTPIAPANGPFELVQLVKEFENVIFVLDQSKLPVLISALKNEEYRKIIFKRIKFIIIMNSNKNEETFMELNEKIIPGKIPIKIFEEISLDIYGKNFSVPFYPVHKSDDDDKYLILFTSGSTGQPKGVVHSNFSYMATLMIPLPLDMEGEQFLLWYPMGHASGAYFLFSNIFAGITNVIFGRTNQVEKLLDYTEKNQLISISLSNEHISKMVIDDKREQFNLENLQHISTCGAKVSSDYIEIIKKRYNVVFEEMYGSSEYTFPTKNFDLFNGNFPHGSVGQPYPGVEIKVLDLETRKNCPPNQNGEVLLRGPLGFTGYLNPKAAHSAIEPDGWYHTGDIGHFDQNGHLVLVDRVKSVIKFRVWSVYPAEIEYFLLSHPSIEDVCVVGVKHIVDNNLVRAYIKIKDGSQINEEEIIKYVQDNMGFQKRLRGGVRFIKGPFPRTGVGKVDRKYFRNLIKDEVLTETIE